jgi:hypothetical protein
MHVIENSSLSRQALIAYLLSPLIFLNSLAALCRIIIFGYDWFKARVPIALENNETRKVNSSYV